MVTVLVELLIKWYIVLELNIPYTLSRFNHFKQLIAMGKRGNFIEQEFQKLKNFNLIMGGD